MFGFDGFDNVDGAVVDLSLADKKPFRLIELVGNRNYG
jgi:hypothetical protein